MLYVVIEGEVRLIRHQMNGGAQVLQRARPGSVLAEASLFSPLYHCDAVTDGPARLTGFTVREIRRRFRAGPEFAEAWAIHLAGEVQTARFRSEVVALRTVAARLDAWLAWRGEPIPARGAWKQIADQIGVTPEALYREMAKRRRPGVARGIAAIRGKA
jgi:CRP-like cAMP-binding protein